MDLLRAAHYEVDYTAGSVAGTSYWETLDPNKLAALDAADLVIVGRDNNSAGVTTDAAEIAAWTNVKTPVMLLSSYIAANHRMFFNAGTQEITNEKTNWGVMNLNAAGQKIFLNAVAFMIVPLPVPITVVNASFELPGTVKIKGWNGEGVAGTPAVDIPGWSSDTIVADSGVETGQGATDGIWTAFLKGADPSVWQSTGLIIGADDTFELSVDARNTWQGTTLRMTLYYEDLGVRVPAATADVTVTGSMQTFKLSLAVKDVPAAAGKVLGIEFKNATTNGESWIGLDSVRLTVK